LFFLPFFLFVNIFCFSGLAIDAQLVPIPEFVLSIPGRISNATYELVFLAVQLPRLGVKSYFIEKSSSSIKTIRSINIYEGKNEDITISNDVIINIV
jgi:lysosomal alpha-mannosidase